MPRGDGTGPPRGSGRGTGANGWAFCWRTKWPLRVPWMWPRDPPCYWRALQPENLPKMRNDDDKKVTQKEEWRLVIPRGDGTGPAGLGPMTGRAIGYCAGYEHNPAI